MDELYKNKIKGVDISPLIIVAIIIFIHVVNNNTSTFSFMNML